MLTRLLLEAAAFAALAVGCYVLHGLWQGELGKRRGAEAQIATMKQAQEIEHDTHQKELAIAGDRAATKRGLQRVCHTINMPVAPAGPHDAARADADAGQPADRGLDQFAGEILACRRNAARLSGLQEFDRARAP